MECPNCYQELPSLPCASCGQKALTGAAFCHNCGHQLPAPDGEEPKLLTCRSCGHPAAAAAKFCAECGESLAEPTEQDEAADHDPGKRTACSDGSCIGIIGRDGKCTDCGKPYSGPAK